jgi:hypothetical protein
MLVTFEESSEKFSHLVFEAFGKCLNHKAKKKKWYMFYKVD